MGKLLLKIILLLVSSLNQVVASTQLCYSPRIWWVGSVSAELQKPLLTVKGCEAVDTERVAAMKGKGQRNLELKEKKEKTLWILVCVMAEKIDSLNG